MTFTGRHKSCGSKVKSGGTGKGIDDLSETWILAIFAGRRERKSSTDWPIRFRPGSVVITWPENPTGSSYADAVNGVGVP